MEIQKIKFDNYNFTWKVVERNKNIIKIGLIYNPLNLKIFEFEEDECKDECVLNIGVYRYIEPASIIATTNGTNKFIVHSAFIVEEKIDFDKLLTKKYEYIQNQIFDPE